MGRRARAVLAFLSREAKQEDRLPLYRMLELYQHDLSNIWDQDLDINGEARLARLYKRYSVEISRCTHLYVSARDRTHSSGCWRKPRHSVETPLSACATTQRRSHHRSAVRRGDVG
jgi:hypothetical protein